MRSGSFKVYALSDEGDEQVLGFYLPGDWLGLEGLNAGYHGCSALALETSSVCEVACKPLEKLAQTLPPLSRQLQRRYRQEIARDYALLRLLGRKSAEQRLAGFLLDLGARLAERGFSGREFNLSMSRHDIGNYLGLALETVSRLFARLQEAGVLAVDRRSIAILDPAGLRTLAGDNPVSQRQRCYR